MGIIFRNFLKHRIFQILIKSSEAVFLKIGCNYDKQRMGNLYTSLYAFFDKMEFAEGVSEYNQICQIVQI